MSSSLHPLQTTERIRQNYLRYLKTIYPFQERDLRDQFWKALETTCLLYTSDAADELLCVDIGSRRIIKKQPP